MNSVSRDDTDVFPNLTVRHAFSDDLIGRLGRKPPKRHGALKGFVRADMREALLAMGCEMGQGFLLGHPAPIAQWPTPRQGAIAFEPAQFSLRS